MNGEDEAPSKRRRIQPRPIESTERVGSCLVPLTVDPNLLDARPEKELDPVELRAIKAMQQHVA